MQMVRILYVNAGEAESDLGRQLAYRAVDPPLTEHGQEQAERLARVLAGQDLRLHPEILGSPLKRAQETATILATELGCSVVADDRLREIDVGELDGRSDEDAWRAYTEIVHRRWAAGEWSRRFPGGEHLRGLAQRVRTALLHAARPDPPGDTRTDVLVVGHGPGLRAALPYLIKNVEAAYPNDPLSHCAVACFLAGPATWPAVLRLLGWDVPAADLPRLAAEQDLPGWQTF